MHDRTSQKHKAWCDGNSQGAAVLTDGILHIQLGNKYDTYILASFSEPSLTWNSSQSRALGQWLAFASCHLVLLLFVWSYESHDIAVQYTFFFYYS